MGDQSYLAVDYFLRSSSSGDEQAEKHVPPFSDLTGNFADPGKCAEARVQDH